VTCVTSHGIHTILVHDVLWDLLLFAFKCILSSDYTTAEELWISLCFLICESHVLALLVASCGVVSFCNPIPDVLQVYDFDIEECLWVLQMQYSPN
jgi:hypothetical protein